MADDSSFIEDQFSIQGASALFRKGRLLDKVSARVAKIDKDKAYRIGIGPLEYDAILEHRISAVDIDRLESILAKLSGEPG